MSAPSSNSFACGSNQNCGNVMTGRSSTRLHAPPGGGSSFNIFDHSGAPDAGAGTSNNKFATGTNQNSGNVMTGRSSTRLHAPPGGTTSISFG